MSLPVKTFWFMSDCIDRIQSQEDQRHFRVVNNAQGGEETQEYVEGLAKAVGQIYVVDEKEAILSMPLDSEGLNELRMLQHKM